MDQFAMTGMKQAVSSQVNSMKSSLKSQPNNIKWDDFNYPPLIHLIHYSSDELPDSTRGLVRRIHASFVILVVILFINLINCIVQSAQGGEAINIFYSVLNILIFLPLGMFAFYRGYRGLASDEYLLKFYKIVQGILVVLYIIFSIIAAGAFNGWLRVKDLFGKEEFFPGALSVIESVLYTINAILAISCILSVSNYRGGSASDKV